MKALEKLKNSIQKIPEFSDKNYTLAGYVCAGIVTLTACLLIYAVLTNIDSLTFKANWNMFKSPLGSLCLMIGLLCAIIFWGRFGHWTRKPIIETRDRYGTLLERKENMDIIEQLFAKVLMPLLGHFVLEPIIYAAAIYYPIQCIIALVGAVFPYILTAIVVAIAVASWFFTRKLHFRYHSVVLIAATVLFTVSFSLGAYAILGDNAFESTDNISNVTGDSNAISNDSTTSTTATSDSVNISNNEASQEQTETNNENAQEDEDDQFGGESSAGLFGSLPNGTTAYSGDMAGFPIEFTIHKNGNELRGDYKNVKYGTVMHLTGESLPADDGAITFTGKDKSTTWTFEFSGDAENITGKGICDGKELNVNLHKK